MNDTLSKPETPDQLKAESDSMRRLARPYFSLNGVSEVPESQYHGMKVGMPPVCICCRRGTDGPVSGCAEALCFECYELVRTRGRSLRTNVQIQQPATREDDEN
jgi:hypothetical protein